MIISSQLLRTFAAGDNDIPDLAGKFPYRLSVYSISLPVARFSGSNYLDGTLIGALLESRSEEIENSQRVWAVLTSKVLNVTVTTNPILV